MRHHPVNQQRRTPPAARPPHTAATHDGLRAAQGHHVTPTIHNNDTESPGASGAGAMPSTTTSTTSIAASAPTSPEHAVHTIAHAPLAAVHVALPAEHSTVTADHAALPAEHAPSAEEYAPLAADHAAPTANHPPPDHAPSAEEYVPLADDHPPLVHDHPPLSAEHVAPTAEPVAPTAEHAPLADECVPLADDHSPLAADHAAMTAEHAALTADHAAPTAEPVAPTAEHVRGTFPQIEVPRASNPGVDGPHLAGSAAAAPQATATGGAQGARASVAPAPLTAVHVPPAAEHSTAASTPDAKRQRCVESPGRGDDGAPGGPAAAVAPSGAHVDPQRKAHRAEQRRGPGRPRGAAAQPPDFERAKRKRGPSPQIEVPRASSPGIDGPHLPGSAAAAPQATATSGAQAASAPVTPTLEFTGQCFAADAVAQFFGRLRRFPSLRRLRVTLAGDVDAAAVACGIPESVVSLELVLQAGPTGGVAAQHHVIEEVLARHGGRLLELVVGVRRPGMSAELVADATVLDSIHAHCDKLQRVAVGPDPPACGWLEFSRAVARSAAVNECASSALPRAFSPFSLAGAVGALRTASARMLSLLRLKPDTQAGAAAIADGDQSKTPRGAAAELAAGSGGSAGSAPQLKALRAEQRLRSTSPDSDSLGARAGGDPPRGMPCGLPTVDEDGAAAPLAAARIVTTLPTPAADVRTIMLDDLERAFPDAAPDAAPAAWQSLTRLDLTGANRFTLTSDKVAARVARLLAHVAPRLSVLKFSCFHASWLAGLAKCPSLSEFHLGAGTVDCGKELCDALIASGSQLSAVTLPGAEADVKRLLDRVPSIADISAPGECCDEARSELRVTAAAPLPHLDLARRYPRLRKLALCFDRVALNDFALLTIPASLRELHVAGPSETVVAILESVAARFSAGVTRPTVHVTLLGPPTDCAILREFRNELRTLCWSHAMSHLRVPGMRSLVSELTALEALGVCPMFPLESLADGSHARLRRLVVPHALTPADVRSLREGCPNLAWVQERTTVIN